MSLEKANITWTFQQLTRMIIDGKIDLNHIVQRGLAWERSRQSALIESAIIGYPIPAVFAKSKYSSGKESNSSTAPSYFLAIRRNIGVRTPTIFCCVGISLR